MVTIESLKNKESKVCVVGLGYVGLPLAVLLAKNFSVIGLDVKQDRIEELQRGEDHTREVLPDDLKAANIDYSYDPKKISDAKFIIVAVPTPVKEGVIPDMSLVEKATEMVAKNLTKDTVISYESTVYPGATEEICVPILEKVSGLKAGVDFKVGYSPERVNPGDKEHTISKVVKVVSGMDAESSELIAQVYGTITQVFRAASIKVAEAAKVIENTQRDLNIALMNELAIIFSKMGFSVYDVLAAAGTKWNFLKFQPGLVGGHCIGVDPYYLTFKAQTYNYHPEVILAGRKINDNMGAWIVDEIIKKIVAAGKDASKMKVLIAGMTFKEDVPDIRNSKVFDIYNELKAYGISPFVCDPIAVGSEVKHEYNIELSDMASLPKMDLVVIAVAHKQYRAMKVSDWKNLMNETGFIADVKGLYAKDEVISNGIQYWRM